MSEDVIADFVPLGAGVHANDVLADQSAVCSATASFDGADLAVVPRAINVAFRDLKFA
jgi:hypothetical protein